MALLKVWGEECYGASDGASSLPIYLPLFLTASYAGSATRIVTKSVSDKIFQIKREMENKKQEIICVLPDTH